MTALERAERFAKRLTKWEKTSSPHRPIPFGWVIWPGAWYLRSRAYRALLKQRIRELPQSVMEDKYQVDCFVRMGLEQALELFDAIHSHNTAS